MAGGAAGLTTLSQPETPFAAPTTLPGSARSEESDDYGEVVAILNPTLRVIRGKCGLQWIAQKKNRPARWSSFAYCATKEGLLLRLPKGGHGCDPEAWGAIEALPDYYPKQAISVIDAGIDACDIGHNNSCLLLKRADAKRLKRWSVSAESY